MIGASFSTFLVLLVEAFIAATVLQYLFRYRLLEGVDGFLAKLGAAWVGAWLGSPILGHWFESMKFADVYLIPGLIGAFAVAFSATAFGKGLAVVLSAKPTPVKGEVTVPEQRHAA